MNNYYTEIEDTIKINVETISKKQNLVSREEFEVQKKIITNLKKDLIKLKKRKKKL